MVSTNNAFKVVVLVAFFLGCISNSFAQFGRNRSGQNNEEVVFFSRDNFRGEQVRQKEGSFRSINWSINSIQIPAGYSVEAYSQDNFRGQPTRFQGNVARLGAPIRSIRINRETTNDRPTFSNGRGSYSRPGRNDTKASVLFFADINYKGNSLALAEGRHRSSELRMLVRQASSIDIPAGYKVQVFDTENFTGNSYVFTSSSNDLRSVSWNDRITSVIISRGR